MSELGIQARYLEGKFADNLRAVRSEMRLLGWLLTPDSDLGIHDCRARETPTHAFGLATPASPVERNVWDEKVSQRQTAYSSFTDLNYPTGALTGGAVQAPVWFLIEHPGSRARHLQNRYPRVNSRVQ
jgi:hypothetical protein